MVAVAVALASMRKSRPTVRLILTVLLGCVLLWSVTPASAQISPGPLSRAHQSLTGATNCTTCHKLGAAEASFKCLDCHAEISMRLAARKGLHASYHIEPGSSQECARCHSEHNGEDFPLIKWDPKTFDHKQTGYVLEGKHAGLACNRCHTADRIPPSERSTIKVKDLSKTFLGISPACVTCHQDEHKGRLGPNCLQCHNFSDWKTVTVGQFDHSKTRYPLTGLHAQVACQKCHTPGADNKPRYTGIPFEKCADCHSDPHRGSFVQTCESCHNTNSWKRISLTVVNERFDHSKTKFPLLGKHTSVDCAQCHAGGDFKKPLVFQKCMDCHKPDPHNGQFAKRPDGGECASCHTVEGWKPSTFTAKDHASSAYPARGKARHGAVHAVPHPEGKGHSLPDQIPALHRLPQRSACQTICGCSLFQRCERCHNLKGYKPSTFTLARHKETHFVLSGGHIAVPCGDCHKESTEFKPKPSALYHWQNLTCTSCHADPHKAQFKERMQVVRADGSATGCEACHSTKSWKELSRFDHSKTSFPLVGSHRATACIDCHKPPNLETGLINVDFKAAPSKCEDCHEDAHGRQFARNEVTPCAECHNSMKWKPSLFDHDQRTKFALQGAHRNVRCEACHKDTRTIAGKLVLFYKPTPTECAACHGPSPPPNLVRRQ